MVEANWVVVGADRQEHDAREPGEAGLRSRYPPQSVSTTTSPRYPEAPKIKEPLYLDELVELFEWAAQR